MKLKNTRGAGMIEYGLVTGGVAVAAIFAVLLFGDANRTGICVADTTLAAEALGDEVDPCVSRVVTPPQDYTPAPSGPTYVEQQQPVILPSEMAGFLNPDGPIPVIQAVTDQGTNIQGSPNEDIYLELLCEYLGYELPQFGASYGPADTVNATFLPDGRLSLTETPGLAWVYDDDAPAYAGGDTTPVFVSLTCTETVMVEE